ncbi:MAG: DUF531 family protein [Thermoplasmatales archaeon]|nr:DUF531 family protein [Thermoplasmatales archaeon]
MTLGRGRVTLGLYNSYDPGKFREAHRRALARAGGLAKAFGMNLALFGFPFPDGAAQPVELAEWVAGTTSIGEGGAYFVELAREGRFLNFPYPSKGFPPQLGEPILATSKPDPSKDIAVNEVVAMVSSGRSVLVLFGLGPHGMPKAPASIPRLNMDVTGGGYSLETCTALGAVAALLSERQ